MLIVPVWKLDFIRKNDVVILNVAGNRLSSSPNIESIVKYTLSEAIRLLNQLA